MDRRSFLGLMGISVVDYGKLRCAEDEIKEDSKLVKDSIAEVEKPEKIEVGQIWCSLYKDIWIIDHIIADVVTISVWEMIPKEYTYRYIAENNTEMESHKIRNWYTDQVRLSIRMTKKILSANHWHYKGTIDYLSDVVRVSDGK